MHGSDAEKLQDSLSGRKPHKAGVRFACVKATEDSDALGPRFASHGRGAQ